MILIPQSHTQQLKVCHLPTLILQNFMILKELEFYRPQIIGRYTQNYGYEKKKIYMELFKIMYGRWIHLSV